MSFASGLQARETARILRLGEPLTVTRAATTQGGTPTTQTLYARPEALNTAETGQFMPEALANFAETNPQRFIFAGDADVKVGDSVAYDGSNYNISNINPGARVSGVSINLHAYGSREQRALS